MKPDSQPVITTKLVNFRVPIRLKANLDQVCRFNHQSKTSVLLMLIRDFIKDQSVEIDRELARQRKLDQQLESISQKSAGETPIETWNGFAKDPVTHNWSKVEE